MTPELTTNLQVIATRFPEVFEELKGLAYAIPDSQSRDRFLNDIYGVPDRDALIDRWSGLAPTTRLRVVLTSGFGDGSHIRKLLEKLPNSSTVCVLECDPAMLLAVLQDRDLSTLLNDPRFVLLTPFCYRDIIARLNLELIGIESASTFLYAPIHQRSPELYNNVISVVLRQLSTRWNQLKTDVDNAEIVFTNTIENFSRLGFASNVLALHNLFEGKPLILVGAGPSLDESMDFLKSVTGKAVIAVVNSAYRAVVNQGIRPDLTVAVDPKEGTLRGYRDTDTSKAILVCTYLVYPEVPPLFGNRVFPLSSYNFLMTLLRKLLNLPEEPGIVGDGTVSSTIVNLAAFMGCKEIYLVGQDMAVRKDGRMHNKDSFYSDIGADRVSLSACKWVDGNHGEKVPVEEKLFAYLKIFEDQISSLHSIRFFNLAREGAKVHGASYLEYDQALARIESLPECSFHEILEEKLQASRMSENLFRGALMFFKRYSEFIEPLIEVLMHYCVHAEMHTEIQHLKPSDPELKDTPLASAYAEILRFFKDNPLFTSILVEGRTKREYHDFICTEEEWSLITDTSASILQTLPQAWAIVEGSIFQLETIQRYLLEQ